MICKRATGYFDNIFKVEVYYNHIRYHLGLPQLLSVKKVPYSLSVIMEEYVLTTGK